MATRINVIRGGDPVEGATIIVGGVVGSELTTNERGNVSFDLDADWQGFVDIKIIAGSVATATLHIIEGETHMINLGAAPE